MAPGLPPQTTTQQSALQPPIHQYARARDATLPTANLHAPVVSAPAILPNNATTAQRHAENAYHNVPPVYDKKHASDVFESVMEAPITMTHRQLYSIAPEVCAQTREVLSGKRIAADMGKTREVQFLDADEDTAEEIYTVPNELIYAPSVTRVAQFTQDMPDSFAAAAATSPA